MLGSLKVPTAPKAQCHLWSFCWAGAVGKSAQNEDQEWRGADRGASRVSAEGTDPLKGVTDYVE